MSERGRSLPWLALLLLAALAIGATLISAGVFDPPVNGVMVGERPLPSPTTLSPDGLFLTWLDEPLPTTNYTVRLTAVHKSGEPDVAYGLIIGDAVTVLVSPLGYVTVRVGETAVVVAANPSSPDSSSNMPTSWWFLAAATLVGVLFLAFGIRRRR